MAPVDLKVFKDETAENRVRATIEADTVDADRRINPRPISLRKGRRLDVDEVLARSLPRVLEKV